MKPVDQKILGFEGDCFRACLASMLEMDLDDVPHFMVGLPPDGAPDFVRVFFTRVNRWLAPRGLSYFEVRHSGPLPDWAWYVIPRDGYWIAAGPGHGGLDHCVVMNDREMVHDPSPSRLGLVHIDTIGLLVALDPAKVCRHPVKTDLALGGELYVAPAPTAAEAAEREERAARARQHFEATGEPLPPETP